MMNCPACNQDVQETNYKCPHCGHILKTGVEPGDFIPPPVPSTKATFNATTFILIIFVIGVSVLGFLVFQHLSKQSRESTETTASTPSNWDSESSTEPGQTPAPSTGSEANAAVPDTSDTADANSTHSLVPGEPVKIERLIIKGQTTIFDFYSVFCPPCMSISPLLESLDEKRNDISVVKININREGIKGIDWDSPVVKQFDIHSIPFFIIYDGEGRKTHEGNSGSEEVYRLLNEENLLNN